MKAIINNFDYPVIKIDDRDPEVSWANHRARGSAGGVDLAYPYGSPVYAPADGAYQYFDGNGRVGKGSGGNIGRLRLPSGDYVEFMHLASGSANRKVKTGDLLGQSGASGYGNLWHYSPHLHVHIYVGGVRRNLWHYFTTSATAGTTTQEIDMAITEAEWARIDLANAGAAENLLKRIGATVWEAQLAHKSGIHGSAREWLLNTSDMAGAILAKPSTVIDPAKLAAELTKAGVEVTVDTVALVKAIDASLRDDFAAIPGAVRADLKSAL